MSVLWWIILAAAWLGWAVLSRRLEDNPRGDVVTGFFYFANRLYARLVHRVRVRGEIPGGRHTGPLIVVCNHTAGVDPLLVQGVTPFEVRWMMGSDMMTPRLGFFWQWARIIAVNRRGRDLGGTREALRHLADGGVLGVFPEGGLERPPGRLRAFQPGIGFLVARTRAPVLPIWISGTPQADKAWESLWRTSRSTLTVGPVMDFAGATPGEIVAALEGWFRETSGWARESEPQADGPAGAGAVAC
ncbi:MAG: lysophospholipid acyltransferase family protein [Planctomycetota bacterium]|nr:lysophospholipid acyltransferase family protein [Planctomycetota bacterium]